MSHESGRNPEAAPEAITVGPAALHFGDSVVGTACTTG